MKPIVEKILKSGLVDKHMAQMLEHWGNLPSGASELVPTDSDHLKKATRGQLDLLAEEIGEEVDKLHTLKETQLDLNRLRWPTEVSITDEKGHQLAYKIPAVIDRMGRLYFRIQDIDKDWFVPGYELARDGVSKEDPNLKVLIRDQILESTVLYADEQPVCLQVSVQPLA